MNNQIITPIAPWTAVAMMPVAGAKGVDHQPPMLGFMVGIRLGRQWIGHGVGGIPGVADLISLLSSSNARVKAEGNVRPRFAARRRMPLAAFGLKENRGGHGPSKMADNEDATAPLGDSEPARVKNPVGPPIP